MSSISSLTKTILRTSARRVTGLVRAIRQPSEPILFLYGGRTKHWPGMGRTLYEQEPVFKQTVQTCCQYFLEFTGEDVLPNFEGPLDNDFFAGGNRVAFSILTIQLALTDLWAARGIRPDATLGVSLGEFAAAYASGGLTLRDVIRICSAWKTASYLEDKAYLSLFVGCPAEQATTLCRNSPVKLWVVYQTSQGSVILLCREEDKLQATAYLDANGVVWQHPFPDTTRPFHTSLFRNHHQLVWNQLSQIELKPLQLDFYSSTKGKKIPRHTVIDPTMWYELLCSPVLFYSAIDDALKDGYTAMTHVGPHPFVSGSASKAAFSLPDRVRLHDSMRSGTDERQQFQATYQRLKSLIPIKRRSMLVIGRNRGHKPVDVLADLNLQAQSTIENAPAVYDYLQVNHRVCFLPWHKAWLVLRHEDVNYVLQQPNLFSNSPYREVDPFLLGADLPDHTTIRTLLKPLFSPSALTSLREHIANDVNHRLDALVIRTEFDVVGELTIPLVQSVMAHFMGLRPMEAESLHGSLTGHLYGMGYLSDLERFFTCYMQQLPTQGDQAMGALLMHQVRTEQLPLAAAVSLMRLMWAAGTSTTSILLTDLVNTLVRQPQLASQLRNDRSLIPAFVEEVIRLNPPESVLWRVVTQPTILAGQSLEMGSRVMVSLLAANRDPAVFTAPGTCNLTRPAKRILSFGGGMHHCLGAGIARLQAQVMVEAVLDRMPGIQLVEAPPVYYPSTSLRGLAQLVIRPS
ncbi:cytochrome P450 [Fibrella aquatica]|uniref:cytochrome P450 n=1 Tax=Fibrella aquatica TaxID=3242487 RepID=UPI003520DD8D